MLKKNINDYLEKLEEYTPYLTFKATKKTIKLIKEYDIENKTISFDINLKALNDVTIATVSFLNNNKDLKTTVYDVDMNAYYLKNAVYAIKGNVLSYENNRLTINIKQFLTNEDQNENDII